MHRRLFALFAVVSGTLALIAGLMVGSAGAATDNTPPVWSKPPTNSIPLGAQLQPAGVLGDCDSWYLPGVSVSFAARDPESGISRYGESFYELTSEDAETVTSPVRLTTWVIDNLCGCGGCLGENFYAWNSAGLHAAWQWDEEGLAVVQDDRFDGSTSDYQAGGVADLRGVYMTYNGTWATSAANAFSGGTTQKTTQSGASATLHIDNQPYLDSYGQVDYGLGLLMAKAPDRGKAAIFLDGVRVATVDTHAASKLNRTVVWRSALAGNTGHTVRVVNLATPGRTRIDIDAFVLLQKVHGGALDPAVF
jgi:hypothetical protein